MDNQKSGVVRWIVLSMMIAAVALIAGCDKDEDNTPDPQPPQVAEYGSEAAQEWMGVLLDRVKTESLNPPFASRIIGYTGVTMYECCVDGMPNNISLTGQLTDLGGLPSAQTNVEYHWPAVVNAATSSVLLNLFAAKPASVTAINDKRATLHTQYAATVSDNVLNRSEAYGEAVATAINAWIAGDNYAVAITNCTNYQPSGMPGRWEPTYPDYAPALLPCWGEMRHFLSTNISSECEPGPPPTFSLEEGTTFRAEMDECYYSCSNASDEEEMIANFWADNPGATFTPPGHWVSILKQLAEDHNYDLAKVVETLAGLGVSQADAFTLCWATKYQYDLIRPITLYRELYDPEWNSIVGTPNFPEYTSGHSVQSGAASTVLEYFLGDVSFDDRTHTNNTVPLAPRHFDNFREAADEAGISRLYGGIHFRAAIDNGLAQGRCIGGYVVALQFRANS